MAGRAGLSDGPACTTAPATSATTSPLRTRLPLRPAPEQRRAELGLRRALGARSGDIPGLILREAAVLSFAGIAAGVVGALVLTWFIQGMLFSVRPLDPATLAFLAFAMLAVAMLAALVPAVRAVRADPMAALRTD